MAQLTHWNVPYTAFRQNIASIKTELLDACEKVIDSERYILGPEVEAFESEFADYCNAPFAVGVSNGTAALYLVLHQMGISTGDEVITAPNSFIATASAIALNHARPVFVDIMPDGNINPDLITDAITPKTKAIIPVHLTGRPARMPEILKIANEFDLFVIEDAAQSVGAHIKGKKVGSWGNAACFSLHPLKNLFAFGDGGIITVQDLELSENLRLARNHGLVTREQCNFWSINSRLDEIQAAMLRVQLRHLNQQTDARRRLAFRYNSNLKQYVSVPEENNGEYCVYQTYMIQSENRNELKKYLNEHGVEALIHYPTPIHLQPAARYLGYSVEDFPMTMQFVNQILSLPLNPSLTIEQQDQVIELIAQFHRS